LREAEAFGKRGHTRAILSLEERRQLEHIVALV
jgi:hypothetical protein